MISLTDVPRRLRKEHGIAAGYREVYKGVIDGVLPAERGSNGRWQIAEDDLPSIAEALVVARPSGPSRAAKNSPRANGSTGRAPDDPAD